MSSSADRETLQQALVHYGNARWSDAEACCRRLLASQPRQAEALHLLGVIAHRAGFTSDAVALVRQAVASDPRAAYHSNLGVFLTALGRFDAAADACRAALVLDDGLVDAHYNLGNALAGARDLEAAALAYRRALAARVDFVPAHNNLGNVLKDLGRHGEAIGCYRQALAWQPAYAEARSNLATALKDTGRLDEALVELRQAVATAPDSAAIRSNLIVSLHYDPRAAPSTLLDEASRWGERFGSAPSKPLPRHDGQPLHIGFVSPDLRLHSVAFFLLPLLEALDHRLRVTCYATGAQVDEVTRRLRDACDRWVGLVGLTDEVAAERIRADRIDVLFDLSGHTAGHRLTLFAHRPAPVQVTYLGFPGTTGLRAIDHRLTDALADPPDTVHFDSEHLVRMPSSAWCFAPPCATPDASPPPLLRQGHATFGYFGNLAKVTASMLETWAALLTRMPTALLRVKSASLRDRETVQRYQRSFAALGIEGGRVQFLPDDPSLFEHLRSYERVDIVLDTSPFNGLTTTCQALWMGVPVVTLAGGRQASRMGRSVLTNLGLDRLVAATPAAYVEAAATLAADRAGLVALRAGLRARFQCSPVGDAARFARDFEDLCRDLWRERQPG